MSLFLSNRDGVGADPSLTNEEGHFRMLSTLISGGGDVVDDSVEVSQNSPLGMSVLIGTGDFKIDSGSGYAYMGWNSSNATVTITTADPANPRIDAIVLYVDKGEDTQDSIPNNPGIIKAMAVAGSPNAVPIAPNNTAIQTAVGAGNPFTRLANVLVGAGVTQITNANITDTRIAITLQPYFIGDSSISTAKIDNLAVTTGKIADLAVTTAKIDDGAVTNDKLAGGITADKTAFGGNYSTSEVDTGFTWVDGKTIYKKTVNFGALPNNTSKNVAHGITDISYVIDVHGIAANNTPNFLPISYRSATAGIWFTITTNNITINTSTDLTAYTTTYATLYYTKT